MKHPVCEYCRELSSLMKFCCHNILTFFWKNCPEVTTIHWFPVYFGYVHFLLCEKTITCRIESFLLAQLRMLIQQFQHCKFEPVGSVLICFFDKLESSDFFLDKPSCQDSFQMPLDHFCSLRFLVLLPHSLYPPYGESTFNFFPQFVSSESLYDLADFFGLHL